MKGKIGLALLGVGFLVIMTGAGTSDLADAQAMAHHLSPNPFAGIWLALFGLLIFAAGARLVSVART